MSLSAFVYKRLEELPFTKNDLHHINVDPRTGIISFEDHDLYKRWREEVIAAEALMGNTLGRNDLASEIESVMGGPARGTMLVRKFLAPSPQDEGIAQGAELSALRHEALQLKTKTEGARSGALDYFLRSVIALVEAAEKHRNPIVIV